MLTHRTDEPGADRLRQVYNSSVRRSALNPVIVPAELSTGGGDDVLLEEVESAVARPRVQELTAIDAITPAAR
jgi:hypothetical protein